MAEHERQDAATSTGREPGGRDKVSDARQAEAEAVAAGRTHDDADRDGGVDQGDVGVDQGDVGEPISGEPRPAESAAPAADISPPPADEPAAAFDLSEIKLPSRVPNGTVGKPYLEHISTGLSAESIEAGATISVRGVEQAGLDSEVNGSEITLRGTPTQDGEFPVKVVIDTPRTAARPSIPRNFELSLLINPDPRSLWVELEPDAALPYGKPHATCDRVAGKSVMIAASRRGRSHAREGTYRDDDFTLCQVDESGWHLMVVADGAGSAEFSRRGSRIACDVVRERMTPHLADGGSLSGEFAKLIADYSGSPNDSSGKRIQNLVYTALGGAAYGAYKAVEAEAESRDGAQASDFATTLLFVAGKQFERGWFFAAYGVGDGGIVIFRDDRVHLLTQPDSGTHGGQTRFLTMPDIWDASSINGRIKFEIVPDLIAAVAMTDGITDPLFQTDNNLRSIETWRTFWDGLGQEVSLDKSDVKAHEQLMEWLNFWSKGDHDDRTIAVLLP